MANVFVVLCTRSPTKALKKHGRVTGFKILQRELADDDVLPDPSWKDRVVAVVEARGRWSERIVDWVENLAAVTDGAVYESRSAEFVYLDKAEAKNRAKRLLVDDPDGLAEWIRVVAPDDSQSRRWETILAIRDVVVRAKTKPPQVVLALHVIDRDDATIEAMVLALSNSGGEDIAKAAARILEQREEQADRRASVPRTIAAVMSLFEGVSTGNASSERRLSRFMRESHPTIVKLVIAAVEANEDPAAEIAAQAVSAVPMSQLSQNQRDQFANTTHGGSLARAFRDEAIAYRDAAGQRASEYAQARFAHYERYREDPLVATPRPRGDDIAMFRGLNDALYGAERNRPQLPLRVVALICDRRFDEARACYVEALGEADAKAAIRDAIDYFAPDID